MPLNLTTAVQFFASSSRVPDPSSFRFSNCVSRLVVIIRNQSDISAHLATSSSHGRVQILVQQRTSS